MLRGTRQMLRVRDAKELVAMARSYAKRAGLQVVERAEVLTPRVNHGRWIADCSCGGGVACDPSMTVAVCFACHDDSDSADPVVAIAPVDWSGVDVAGVAMLLGDRPRAVRRNWESPETVADIAQESVNYGVYDAILGR